MQSVATIQSYFELDWEFAYIFSNFSPNERIWFTSMTTTTNNTIKCTRALLGSTEREEKLILTILMLYNHYQWMLFNLKTEMCHIIYKEENTFFKYHTIF